MHLGVYRYTFTVALSIVTAIAARSQEVNEIPYLLDTGAQKTEIQIRNNTLSIRYSVPELGIRPVNDKNGKFYRVSIPGHLPTTDPGKPEMPVLSRMIVIPEGSSWKIRISNVKSTVLKPSRKNIDGILYPAQESESKNPQQKERIFSFDSDVYASKALIKGDTVKIVPVGSVRGKNLGNLIISPVRYNPEKNTIDVIHSMDIEVVFDKDLYLSDSKSTSSESAVFASLLEKGTLNYTPDDLITGYSDKPVRMLVLTDSSFKKQIAPYLLWKTQKGYKMEVLYKGATLAGDTYTAIKTTIQNIYNSATTDNPAPDYLLIIGDINRIPYYGTGQVTDMYYGEFTGNGDYIPEMFIGRIPASDTGQVRSTLSKIIQYEKFAFADTATFYKKALATAGYDGTYASYLNGQVKYSVANYLIPQNKIQEYHFYYPQPSTTAHKDSIITLINKGLSFINYTGHGATTSWLHINFATSDTSKLNNKSMYPFIISNACQTARFSTSSLGNALQLAKNKGTIGFIGCSNDSYWDEDFYWYVGLGTPSADPKYESTGLGAADRLFHTHNEKPGQWYTTMGQIIFAGNMAVSASTSLRKKYYWETYNLVGDPSVIPVIGTPSKFTAVIPDTIPNKIKSLTLTADPFAYVAISRNGILWDASYVSPSGSVTLTLPGISNDSCLLVITGQNKIPLIKTIRISGITSEYINLTKSVINDKNANNNGLVDFGETVTLDVTVSNLGLEEAKNLTAKISSTSSWITMVNDTYAIGNLAGGSEVNINNILSFSVSRSVPDGGIATIELLLKDDKQEKKFFIDFPVHAPKLSITNCVMKDSGTGNGNFIADKGETVQMIFQIMNSGSSSTSGQVTVSSPQSDITIIDQVVASGNLLPGTTTEVAVRVKIGENAVTGSTFSVTGNLNCDPILLNKSFSFRIGKIRESFESLSFKVFPWINLSTSPWKITQLGSVDGTISARSGEIGHNGLSSLSIRTNYSAADTLKFYYKVSSEASYDFLIFKLNGKEIFKASGESGWIKKAIPVPAGYNILEWIYKKDQAIISGSDCAFIDMIDFAASGSIVFIARDLVTVKVTSPVQKDVLSKELVTAKVINSGPDTISGFTLGYILNNNNPVIEKFTNKVIPFGDTVTVTFSLKANLSFFGKYNLSVYGTANNDDYNKNDTILVRLENKDSLALRIIDPENDDEVVVYPNPITDEFKIYINSDTVGTATISLTDISGKLILVEKRMIDWGENLLTIRTSNIAASLYYLKIVLPDKIKVIPLVKVNR